MFYLAKMMQAFGIADVGYALSGTEVAAAIRPGIGRRTAVATGACLH